MGVNPNDLINREFECIECGDRIKMEVKKGTRAIRNCRCMHCDKTKQFFATDVLKRIEGNEE